MRSLGHLILFLYVCSFHSCVQGRKNLFMRAAHLDQFHEVPSKVHLHLSLAGSSVDRNLIYNLFTCKVSFGLPCLDFSMTGLWEADFCTHIQRNEGPGEWRHRLHGLYAADSLLY
ncbi:hypothetical protein Pint_25842 [Pistacia integerrima]|uniref:Uncharacterized protein n=1 Tax=Pistacia integerrima TaxID=434235 RepID=A0ACC0YFE0_9ROSI|nr:hypothetical protein Pint_25842 [Pistacia integerrima]